MKIVAYGLITILFFGLFVPPLLRAGEKTDITWLGQAGFRIITPAGRVLFVDPWLTTSANTTGEETLRWERKPAVRKNPK